MSEHDLARLLQHLLELACEERDVYDALDAEDAAVVDAMRRTRSYEEAGMLTRDAGFVVYEADGGEVCVTVGRRR